MDHIDIKTWWPIVWACVLSVVQIVQILLSKTYARKEEVATLEKKVNDIETLVKSMPTHDDMSKLRIEMSETRGEIKELRAALKPIDHLTKILIEKEMKE